MAACNIQDRHPAFKHYCRVCKKGFMCGRALGGHMRAHGIGDETGTPDDDDDDNASDWEGGGDDDRVHSPKRMYQLRTNPNRLKSCRTCENCGKTFLSWKSFLEHGNAKCSSEDASESLVSSPDSDGRSGGCWSKRKRSLRSKVGSLSSTCSDEDDLLLATCLVQLANTTVDLPMVEPEESSASKEEEERRNSKAYIAPSKSRAGPRGLFECKACKKVFNSHQALGGHRASHKKVKGCHAAKQDEPDDNNNNVTISPTETNINDQELFPSALVGMTRRKSKVHECSICHRVFNSGQALGGHKRCHWIISNSPEMPKFQFQDQNADKLDLNVPAWADVSGVRRDPRNPLSFDVSTDIKLRPWVGAKDNDAKHGDDNNNVNVSEKVKEDEADSKLKLTKLSDLNDTKAGSSQWLQVGIGSTTTTETAAGCGGGEATPG